VNFGPQTKKLLTCILTHPSGHCSGDYISALPGWCALKFFIRARDCRKLANAYPNWVGGPPPPQKYDILKFSLKFSVCAAVTSGMMGIFSTNFSRPRDELWSTNEKLQRAYWSTRNARMPRADHASPYGTWFFLESFISCHCCQRNFNYLNWLSTRICSAGRPHVWLCHARLVHACYWVEQHTRIHRTVTASHDWDELIHILKYSTRTTTI